MTLSRVDDGFQPEPRCCGDALNHAATGPQVEGMEARPDPRSKPSRPHPPPAMRLRCIRRASHRDSSAEERAPAANPPPEPGRRSYEETRVESAIISFLVNEQPTGATIAQLTLALGFQRDEVEAAVGRLRALEIVTEHAGRVSVGPPHPERQRATENGTGTGRDIGR